MRYMLYSVRAFIILNIVGGVGNGIFNSVITSSRLAKIDNHYLIFALYLRWKISIIIAGRLLLFSDIHLLQVGGLYVIQFNNFSRTDRLNLNIRMKYFNCANNLCGS